MYVFAFDNLCNWNYYVSVWTETLHGYTKSEFYHFWTEMQVNYMIVELWITRIWLL